MKARRMAQSRQWLLPPWGLQVPTGQEGEESRAPRFQEGSMREAQGKPRAVTCKGSWRFSGLSSPCRDDESEPRERQLSAIGHTAQQRFKPWPPASQIPSSHLTLRFRAGNLTQVVPHLPLVSTDQKWVPETAPGPGPLLLLHLLPSALGKTNTSTSNPNYPSAEDTQSCTSGPHPRSWPSISFVLLIRPSLCLPRTTAMLLASAAVLLE